MADTPDDDHDPLDWLDDRQAAIVDAAITVLEVGIIDEKLQRRLVGALLDEVDMWAQERDELASASMTGKPN